ncbi:hypothetical protein [Oceanobacillus salinisoli]|uniref:hypothetical protein n=1 Tax=Oceanobacillus salinisoli TaxID=2678611 RepID=UPI0018CC2766|nr:hypothetical protein [Oceanobacillus salinisoli]
MEAIALLPLFIMIIIYLAVVGFVIWFAISHINAAKERNRILKDISVKLDTLHKDGE